MDTFTFSHSKSDYFSTESYRSGEYSIENLGEASKQVGRMKDLAGKMGKCPEIRDSIVLMT